MIDLNAIGSGMYIPLKKKYKVLLISDIKDADEELNQFIKDRFIQNIQMISAPNQTYRPDIVFLIEYLGGEEDESNS